MARPKTYNEEEMTKTIIEYTDTNDIPILKEVCYQNNWNHKYIYELAEKNEELSESIKRLLYKKEVNLERKGLEGEIHHTMAIFSLKQLGWKDSQEIKHSGKIASGIDSMSQEEKVKLEKTLRVILAEELNKPD